MWHALSGSPQIQRKLVGACGCDPEQPDIRSCDGRIHPVRRPAYKSVSDANAWNNNFVAEKGVGVAKDGAIGATGATGAFPRDRGVWASGQTYVWNADYRDKVIYLIGGVYYNFLVKNYGASVTAAPTSANGDSNWEAMQKFVNIATDTLFADGANVAGFMFKNNVLKSHNDEGETLLSMA